MPKQSFDPLDRVFNALADPTRRDVVARLASEGGTLTVSTLAQPYPMALPSFTQHLDVLEQAALIESEKVGRQRHVAFRAEAIGPLRSWIDGLGRVEERVGATLAAPVGREPAALLAMATALARDLAPLLAVVATALELDPTADAAATRFSPVAHAGRRLAALLRERPALAADMREALALYRELEGQLAAGESGALQRTSLPLGRRAFAWRTDPFLREVLEEAG